MRLTSISFSPKILVISLLSISAFTTTYAAPVPLDYATLEVRNTVKVGNHVVEKGKQISPANHAKSTVWHVAKMDHHENPGHVVKVYGHGKVSEKEISGLTAVGQHVAHDHSTGAVVMKHVPGQTLAHLAGNIKDHGERQKFINDWKPHVAAKAADYAEHKGVLHGDLNMNNVLIHNNKVDFIDWEHHTAKHEPGFTADKDKIHDNLNIIWDSTQTPPEHGKSSSKKSGSK